MYCVTCGKPLTSDAQFCGSCGARRNEAVGDTVSVQRESIRSRMVDNLEKKSMHLVTPSKNTDFEPPASPTAPPSIAYTHTPEELQTLERRYRRNRIIAFVGPISALFCIIALWGFFALLEEVSETDSASVLGSISALFNLLVPILIAIAFLAIPVGIVMGIIYSNRLQRIPAHPGIQNTQPLVGISGWLILVAFGLVFTALFQVVGAFQSITMFLDGSVAALNDATSEYYIPGFGGYMAMTLLIEIASSIAAIYLLVTMQQRKRLFPKHYFIWIWVLVFVSLADVLFAETLTSSIIGAELAAAKQEGYTALAQAIVGALVWGTYMRVSERVKNTFTK